MAKDNMDKSWIDLANRHSRIYYDGIDNFLTFAYNDMDLGSRIYCPCRKCENRYMYIRSVVQQHLRDHGFWRKYKKWEKHGEVVDMVDGHHNESFYMEDDMVRLVQEALGGPIIDANDQDNGENSAEPTLGPNESNKVFLKLLESANHPLYPGSKKHTVLSFIVRLLQAKVLHEWSDNSLKTLLEILEEAMPEGVRLPKSYYEAHKIVEDLGFSYTTIDACPNSCMLFRGEDINLNECGVCNSSRWKEGSGGLPNLSVENVKQKAAKQVRYFPIKPRLQRLFMCSKTAKLMRWHAEERTNDGVLRHPADSLAWKDFDEKNRIFSADIRNIRLGLASDGFNPFMSMNIVHSTWPIILVPYNLPPLMCMKQPFIFLSILIDGPKAPGDKIDVYMQPLIEELKELFDDGVATFDSFSNQMFQMRAGLLWTINDFPAYANLSGWSTKGEYACPSCNSEPSYRRLQFGKKGSYMCHRRMLEHDHKFRSDAVALDGGTEYRLKPKSLSGVELLEQHESDDILTEYKREDVMRRHATRVPKVDNKQHNWRKKSIFFELPYWKHNLVRHNLDVMHIEKNICDNVLFTILGVAGKSKDNFNSRRDLQLMGIRRRYHLKTNEVGVEYADPCDFEMNNRGKDLFLSGLSTTRMPEGAASNIARRVHLLDRSIGSLKSHDNHILLQQLIPLFIRSSLPANVVQPLIDLGLFFKQICSVSNCLADLEAARDRIVLILCELEKIFPPSFFDVMEHLPIHLADEALLAGCVLFRWMYPIERYLLTLKQYVRNRACPEASIANGYLMEECMNFCVQYLDDVQSKFNRPLRRKNDDDDDDDLQKGENIVLHEITRSQAHRWVLFYTDAVSPFLDEHLVVIRQQFPSANEDFVKSVHFHEFTTWFKDHVLSMQRRDVMLSDEVVTLSSFPSPSAKRFKSYKTNGFLFRVKSIDNHRSTQNSGVTLIQDDQNEDSSTYYGRLTDIIKITYSIDIKYVLFKCDWVNPSTGIKFDRFKFPLVNFKRLLYKNDCIGNEPFILASQAHQVWYAPDPSGQEWLNVSRMPARDLTYLQIQNKF